MLVTKYKQYFEIISTYNRMEDREFALGTYLRAKIIGIEDEFTSKMINKFYADEVLKQGTKQSA